MIKEKIDVILLNPEILRDDLNLMFENAIKYYNVKNNIHKKAKRLQESCLKLYEENLETLNRFKQ